MFKKLKWVIAAGLLIMPAPTVFHGIAGPTPAQAQTVCGFVGPVRVCRTVRRATPRRRTTTRRTTRSRSTRTRSRSRSTRSRAQIVRGDATLQAALNKLGFDAGPPDGQFGPKTRAAIRRFQTAYDQPATGTLTPDQKDFLIAKYTGSDGSTSDGKKTPTQRSADKFLVLLRGGDGTDGDQDRLVLPGDDPGTDGTDGPAETVTLASFCDRIRRQESGDFILGNSSGGSSSPIPREFCFARAHILSETEPLYSKLDNPNPQDLLKRCSNFPSNARFKPILDVLGDSTPDEISENVQGAFQADPDIINSSRICLGLGLGYEAFDVSMAYSTFLSGIGLQGYGEMVAGHFALGLGRSQDASKAQDWYEWTAASLADNADAIAGLPSNERASVLAYLADSISGGGGLRDIALDNQKAQEPSNAPSGGPRNAAEIATDYFALEKYRILKMLPALQVIVGLDETDMNAACSDANADGTLGAFGAGELDAAFVRLCRAAAYAQEQTAAMVQYDQILADAGDPDGQQALKHHRALGR